MTRNPLCSLLVLAPALILAACGTGDTAPDAGQATPRGSAATATPAPSPSRAVPGDYVAGGNEPFWSITTEPGRIVYSSPEKLDGESLPATESESNGWIRFAAVRDGGPLVLEVRKAACEDDMSGFAFSHEARLTRGSETFSGCARLTSEPRPSE